MCPKFMKTYGSLKQGEQEHSAGYIVTAIWLRERLKKKDGKKRWGWRKNETNRRKAIKKRFEKK